MLSEASRVDFDERAYDRLWQRIQSENATAIDDLLTAHKLDALLSDVASPAMNVVPLAGYPGIMMPTGMGADGLPTSLFFYGARWSEAELLAIAYGYEQASHARQAPAFNP
ncbi:amidase [compost metagenome]